jgi:ADP-heptose:LPS heptosyltransferase
MNRKPWACVVRMGGIGDNLIASSLFPLLHQTHNVEVIAMAPQHEVFTHDPYVDKVTVVDPKKLPQGADWQKWFVERAQQYDKFVNLNHSVESTLAFNPGQTPFYWPKSMRAKLANVSYLERTHDIAGLPHEFRPWFYETEEEALKASETIGKVGGRAIGWVLSGTRLDKSHPYSAGAVARLIRELDAPVIMFGGPGKDYDAAKAIRNHVERTNGTVRNLHLALSPDDKNPTWPIRRVLSTVVQCDVVIGPDTGPMWATAMRENQKIMLLSHASPENITKHWRNTTTMFGTPACWPCHQLHDQISTCTPNKDGTAAACISGISVEDIVQTAAKFWRLRP